jgi:hypothetical protein
MVALTCWYIWLEGNKVIFEDASLSVLSVVYKTLGSLNMLPSSQKFTPLRTCSITQQVGTTIACFDGAALLRGKQCGVGGVIKSSYANVYRWYFNCGEGTNTKA